MTRTQFVRLVGVIAAGFFVVFGLWALVAPRTFFDNVALFPPYNRHLLHDVGAFQLGIGASLVLGLVGWDALGTAIGGSAVAATLHLLSHVVDSDLGGRSSDPVALGLVAVALLAAAWLCRPRPASGQGDR